MDTPTGEDGYPNPNNELSDTEYHVAWVVPSVFQNGECALPRCNELAAASWIEQKILAMDSSEHVIVPLCLEHGHFAAEILDDIRCVVGIGGAS